VKLHAEIGDSKVASCPLHQADSEALFERTHASANARSSYAQGLGGACEPVVIDYLGENV
jgi:hypothetical protein